MFTQEELDERFEQLQIDIRNNIRNNKESNPKLFEENSRELDLRYREYILDLQEFRANNIANGGKLKTRRRR